MAPSYEEGGVNLSNLRIPDFYHLPDERTSEALNDLGDYATMNMLHCIINVGNHCVVHFRLSSPPTLCVSLGCDRPCSRRTFAVFAHHPRLLHYNLMHGGGGGGMVPSFPTVHRFDGGGGGGEPVFEGQVRCMPKTICLKI